MDIIVTLPKNTDWNVYQKELDLVKDLKYVINFKVPSFPKNAKIGDKCFLCYRGQVVGWMTIVGFKEKAFICETTGKPMSGKFIQRAGAFTKLETPIDMKGFQGWRYFDHDSLSV